MSIILNNPNKSFYLSETSNNHQLCYKLMEDPVLHKNDYHSSINL